MSAGGSTSDRDELLAVQADLNRKEMRAAAAAQGMTPEHFGKRLKELSASTDEKVAIRALELAEKLSKADRGEAAERSGNTYAQIILNVDHRRLEEAVRYLEPAEREAVLSAVYETNGVVRELGPDGHETNGTGREPRPSHGEST